MADSREIGMRVGAATNQAVSIVANSGGALGYEPESIATYVEGLASKLLDVMDNLTAQVNVKAGFAGTTVAAPQQAYIAPQQVVTQPNATQVQNNGYNTAFSGSSRPLKLAEHPELDGWLHAQCAATGVTEVWDNRGKPDYIAAIQSGSAKTPPPFRSATQGITKSFWPPK